MASSRKSQRSKRATIDLAAHVASRLQTCVTPGSRLLVALSGGVDSVVLFDVLSRLAPSVPFELRALHVNHQLSPNAARWSQFCRALCRERGIACRVARVEVPRGNSVERAARDARYAVLRHAPADFIALAHNADDQAETVLLQLLRGAGVKGLAAMPLLSDERVSEEGVGRKRTRAPILRPLLDIPRSDIVAYAKSRELTWIEDESNIDSAYLRNWLRHEVTPRIATRIPAYRTTLARASRHFAEAAELLDDLARLDAGEAVSSAMIPIERLRALSTGRAKNVLRFLIGSRGWLMPDADRLNEALRQTMTAARGSSLRISLGECELRQHRGVLHLLPLRGAGAAISAVTWNGEREIVLPHLGGVLTMTPRRGTGLSVAQLKAQPVTIRARIGGERLQPDRNRPTRTVKNILQEAQVPPWTRERVPFIYCGETLACIPGVAADHRFHARRGEASVVPVWRSL